MSRDDLKSKGQSQNTFCCSSITFCVLLLMGWGKIEKSFEFKKSVAKNNGVLLTPYYASVSCLLSFGLIKLWTTKSVECRCSNGCTEHADVWSTTSIQYGQVWKQRRLWLYFNHENNQIPLAPCYYRYYHVFLSKYPLRFRRHVSIWELMYTWFV